MSAALSSLLLNAVALATASPEEVPVKKPAITPLDAPNNLDSAALPVADPTTKPKPAVTLATVAPIAAPTPVVEAVAPAPATSPSVATSPALVLAKAEAAASQVAAPSIKPAIVLASIAPEVAAPVTETAEPAAAPAPAEAAPPLVAKTHHHKHKHVMVASVAPDWALPEAMIFGLSDEAMLFGHGDASAAPSDASAPVETPAPSAETPATAPAPAPAMEAPAMAAAAAPAPMADPAMMAVPGTAATVEDNSIEGRRRPGVVVDLPPTVVQNNPGAVAVPPPEAFPTDQFPIPDRWRLAKALCPDKNFVGIRDICHSEFDPYHQNTLKADRPIDLAKKPFFLPIKGDDWFFNLNAISDTIVEPRSFPTPVADQTSDYPGAIHQFGRDRSFVAAQTFIVGAALTKGSTAYKPPDIEYHVTLAYQVNYANVEERRVLNVRSSVPSHRTDTFLGVQELFVDKHLGNRSDRYDFDSLRVGIQPFQADFRGFLFNDDNLGIRLFGNRDDNRYQYNVEAIWRIDKDTNSGLNDLTKPLRRDWILFGSLFAQDFPLPGLTSLASVTVNLNREKKREVDHNGFPIRPALLGDQRPREYDAHYLGYSLDGRIHRVNISSSVYGVIGEDRNSFFTSKPAKIRAYFAAAELSYDIDWIRVKLSGLYASGDKHPKDNTEGGFDAILENPVFAGADTSYFIRQGVPFAGGGIGVSLSQRNGVLNDLRSSKDEGQSNFNNPGTILLGVGADFDILPQVRFSTNINHIWFANTSSLRELRTEGSIPKSMGWDMSGAVIWRPSMVQNAVFRLSAAVFDPGKGFSDLVTNSRGDKRYYSVLFNAILTY